MRLLEYQLCKYRWRNRWTFCRCHHDKANIDTKEAMTLSIAQTSEDWNTWGNYSPFENHKIRCRRNYLEEDYRISIGSLQDDEIKKFEDLPRVIF